MKCFLALLAMLFLLLRPLCDVLAAGHAHSVPGAAAQSSAYEGQHGARANDGQPCCANLEDGVLAKSGEAGAIPAGTHAQALAAVSWIALGYGGISMPAIRKPPGVPPPALSYYARSARIQR